MNKNHKKYILLIKLTSMGDVIHTLAALTDLMRAHPDIKLDWAIDPNFVNIPTWHPMVNNIIEVPIRDWRKQGWFKSFRSGEIKKTIKNLRKTKYEQIIDAQGLLKSALTAKLARNKNPKVIIAGYDKHSIRDSSASFFYNKKYSVSKKMHAVARTRELFAKAFGYNLKDYKLDYGIKNYLKSDKLPWPTAVSKTKKPYIVCLHGTTWNSKLWPNQHWQDFILIAAKAGYAIKLTSGNKVEFDRAINIKTTVKAINPAADIQVLPRLEINDIAVILAHAEAATAVDTGFAHLAAALDLPQVSIYGSTNSKLTSTHGLNQKSIQSEIYCSPCMKRECPHPRFKELGYPPCYEHINAKSVWNELELLISNAKDKKAKKDNKS